MAEVKGLSLQERDRRWALLRAEMGKRDVGALVVFPHGLTGDALFVANREGAVVFPREGEPTLFTRRAEPPAGPNAWLRDVRGGAPGVVFASYIDGVVARLKELGLDGKRIAVAGLERGLYTLVRQPEGTANHASVEAVRKAAPRSTLVDGTPILGEARYVKSEEEIEIIRRSVQIGEASAGVLAKMAAPGVPAAQVCAAMIYEQLRGGAFPTHVAWQGNEWGQPAPRIVGLPPGVIKQGWFFNNEIEPAVQGYTCQVDQPVSVGQPPQLAQELLELGRKAFERACTLMRPGASWAQVIAEVEALGDGAEYGVGFLCHGRGLGDEGPLIVPGYPNDHVKDERIRANTVFILKPHAYVPGRQSENNVTWGDTVVVREDGAVRLGTRPYEIGVAG
jgi:Xaa-Pro aminopeptidase